MEPAERTSETEVEATPAPLPKSGERLRSAREARGLSLKDVAATTRQSVDLLAALESMQTAHISPTILRMQARAYAEFLDLPMDEIAAGYSERRSAPDTANMPGERLRSTQVEKRRRLWPVAAGGGALIVAGLVFWMMQSPTPKTEAAAVTVASRVTYSEPGFAKPVRSADTVHQRELSIRANASAWIEVRGSDGTIFRSRNMAAGEIYYPRMHAAWTVTVRDAGAFEWWLDDYKVGTLGEPGTPVYSVNVDDAIARGQEQLSTALAEAGNARQPR